MPGFPEAVTANPDPAGNFVAPLVIFPHATEGARTGEITIVGYQAPGNVVSADLLVVPGTVAPPDFLSRH
jgi:hypothetical protein